MSTGMGDMAIGAFCCFAFGGVFGFVMGTIVAEITKVLRVYLDAREGNYIVTLECHGGKVPLSKPLPLDEAKPLMEALNATMGDKWNS